MGSENQREAEDVPDIVLYISCMADELSQLAKRHDLEALGYILDMAKLEAEQVSKRRSGQKARRSVDRD
jgi:hypothetical protein